MSRVFRPIVFKAPTRARRRPALSTVPEGANPFAPPPYVAPPALSREEQEAVVLAEVLKGEEAKDAGRAAGLHAARAGAVVLNRPHVRGALLAVLEQQGVDESLLARTIREGLEATRAHTHEGYVVDHSPDHAVRHKFVSTLLDLRGDLDRSAAGAEDTWEATILTIRSRRAARASEE
jgi:hypothetical protein